MGASFHPEVTIDQNGHLPSSQQPLTLEAGETVLRIDAWVFQTGGYCIASVPGPLTGTTTITWTLNPTDYFGDTFTPGEATAMGLMVSEVNGRKKIFHWTLLEMELKRA